jgi:hypothetical protein
MILLVRCNVLPFRLGSWDTGPADRDAQLDAFEEISGQILEYLSAAYENREDRWQAVRIIIQAERLVAEYLATEFDLLLPLQEVLHRLFRAERRIFIRRALLCREEYRPIYKEALKCWDCDADAAEDFRVVEQHLHEGKRIFDDLRRAGG